MTRAGPSLRVLDVEKKSTPTFVYNISVEDFHTYFVGKNKLWVHNGDCASGAITQHSWDKHCGSTGSGTQGTGFIGHPVFGSVYTLQRKIQEFPYSLKEVDLDEVISGVMQRPTLRQRVSDGTVYYDDADKVIVIHRHDDEYELLEQPGTAYRGDEQAFWNAVNNRGSS